MDHSVTLCTILIYRTRAIIGRSWLEAALKYKPYIRPKVSISSGQRNLMKTYYNDANTTGITKIASKKFSDFFGQRR